MQSSWTTTSKALNRWENIVPGRSTRRTLGLIGLMMIFISILLWIYIIDKSNTAKDEYEKADSKGSGELWRIRQAIQLASRSILQPTNADEAYSMISDSWWPAILLCSLAFIAGILLIFQWVYLALKNKNAF